ncbi:hypothetical protein H6F86_25335 [Phormidium sp. FACHB-592]|jgi:hypothetical protein|uniref:XRE family transcriptional regulator n=1 Tax=Stenomitos frigidus AS-A4 TaxID=2933935 RepID=A0ABV0KTG4_9CYAN|nr:hypothetical protein [Phormidium sp. FACHB-592]MBD2077147.1 hypothetical protein [Phormidium sp. FACHB-592]
MYQLSSSEQDQSPLDAARPRNRNRGVLLSQQGWQKLTQAGVLHDQWGNRYSYETLSERSLLNERTVSRILSCEVRVDKRSLKIFFAAFGFQFSSKDYVTATYDPANQTINSLSRYLNTTVHSVETTLSYQELVELHQRLNQDLQHLSHLLHLHEINGSMPLQASELN